MAENQIDGDNNILVAGSLNITTEDLKAADRQLYKILNRKMAAVDKAIAKRHPLGVSVPHSDTPASFSSEKIVESLGSIGVPVVAALEALDATVRDLLNLPDQTESIPSSRIRGIVTESLYGLSEQRYPRAKIETWGDNYVRRYGADKGTSVVFADGREESLDIDYLIRNFIPELIADLSETTPYLKLIDGFISNSMKRRMAWEVIRATQGLFLYRIHFETLFQLSKEMFLQPPHPCFSTRAREFLYVNYDYERLKDNYRKIGHYQKRGDTNRTYYHVKETIHHACSAILCYYSVYMGCGPLAPLYVLRKVLAHLAESDEDQLDSMFKLSELKTDLLNNNQDLPTLTKKLDAIIKSLNRTTADMNRVHIETMVPKASGIYEIAISLLDPYIRKERLSRILKDSKDLPYAFLETVNLKDVLSSFPHLRWEWHRSRKAFWLLHEYNGPVMKHVKSDILLIPIITTELDDIDAVFTHWAEVCAPHKKLCNSIVFVVDEQSHDVKKIVSSIRSTLEDWFIICIEINSLTTILEHELPMAELERTFRESA